MARQDLLKRRPEHYNRVTVWTDLTAKVLSVDPHKRHVVLEEPGGKKKTLKLSKKVSNVDQLKPGETVDMVVTEELVIDVTS